MHGVAAQHAHEVSDLLQMPQRVLRQVVGQIAHKVHVEEVAEAAATHCTKHTHYFISSRQLRANFNACLTEQGLSSKFQHPHKGVDDLQNYSIMLQCRVHPQSPGSTNAPPAVTLFPYCSHTNKWTAAKSRTCRAACAPRALPLRPLASAAQS